MEIKQAMKGIVVFLTIVGLVSLMGFGLAKAPGMPITLSTEKIANEWSAEEHLLAAELSEETVARLETKVSHLEQRPARFENKLYLDPKGFKRQGWKRLVQSHRAELSELQEQIAWRHEPSNQLNAMPVSKEKEKEKNPKKETSIHWKICAYAARTLIHGYIGSTNDANVIEV